MASPGEGGGGSGSGGYNARDASTAGAPSAVVPLETVTLSFDVDGRRRPALGVEDMGGRKRRRAAAAARHSQSLQAAVARQREFGGSGFHWFCVQHKNEVVKEVLDIFERDWMRLGEDEKVAYHRAAEAVLEGGSSVDDADARDAAPPPHSTFELFCQHQNYLRDDASVERRNAMRRLGELWKAEDKQEWAMRLDEARVAYDAQMIKDHQRRRLEDMGYVSNDLVLREQALPMLEALDAPNRGALFAPYVFCNPYSYAADLSRCVARDDDAADGGAVPPAPPPQGPAALDHPPTTGTNAALARRLVRECCKLRTRLAAAYHTKHKLRRALAAGRHGRGLGPAAVAACDPSLSAHASSTSTHSAGIAVTLHEEHEPSRAPSPADRAVSPGRSWQRGRSLVATQCRSATAVALPAHAARVECGTQTEEAAAAAPARASSAVTSTETATQTDGMRAGAGVACGSSTSSAGGGGGVSSSGSSTLAAGRPQRRGPVGIGTPPSAPTSPPLHYAHAHSLSHSHIIIDSTPALAPTPTPARSDLVPVPVAPCSSPERPLTFGACPAATAALAGATTSTSTSSSTATGVEARTTRKGGKRKDRTATAANIDAPTPATTSKTPAVLAVTEEAGDGTASPSHSAPTKDPVHGVEAAGVGGENTRTRTRKRKGIAAANAAEGGAAAVDASETTAEPAPKRSQARHRSARESAGAGVGDHMASAAARDACAAGSGGVAVADASKEAIHTATAGDPPMMPEVSAKDAHPDDEHLSHPAPVLISAPGAGAAADADAGIICTREGGSSTAPVEGPAAANAMGDTPMMPVATAGEADQNLEKPWHVAPTSAPVDGGGHDGAPLVPNAGADAVVDAASPSASGASGTGCDAAAATAADGTHAATAPTSARSGAGGKGGHVGVGVAAAAAAGGPDADIDADDTGALDTATTAAGSPGKKKKIALRVKGRRARGVRGVPGESSSSGGSGALSADVRVVAVREDVAAVVRGAGAGAAAACVGAAPSSHVEEDGTPAGMDAKGEECGGRSREPEPPTPTPRRRRKMKLVKYVKDAPLQQVRELRARGAAGKRRGR